MLFRVLKKLKERGPRVVVLRAGEELCERARSRWYKISRPWGYFGKNVKIGRNVTFKGDTRKVYIGDMTDIADGVTIHAGMYDCKEIRIGRKVHIGPYSFISSHGRIVIGDNTLIGPHCVITDADHEYSSKEIPIRKQGFRTGEVIIGSDCWLGAGVKILRGSRLEGGVVVGAGSVIKENVPKNSIIVTRSKNIILKRR